MLDFTLAAYRAAVEQRLSMRDVTPTGFEVKINMDGFLRSDTKTRMETYEIGMRVDAYTSDEVRELEDRPRITESTTGRMSVAELTLALQKIYLAVGVVITPDEARDILNRGGAQLGAVDVNQLAPSADPRGLRPKTAEPTGNGRSPVGVP
jgi:hypothetical protein